ncbi:MAG: VWA domain-containing protein [Sneathiellaceae bacterium]
MPGSRPQLTVVTTDAESRIARLHRYIARRDDMRATFQDIWQRLEAGPVGAWREDWSAAALRLFEVNAGPAVQMAFWRLSLTEARRCEAAALIATADTAGGICRHCGSAAARGFLERAGQLLAATDGARALGPWLDGLLDLATAGAEPLAAVLQRLEMLLGTLDGPGFRHWVESGLAVAAQDRAKLRAFFALEDPLARQLLQRSALGDPLGKLERSLQIYLHALTEQPVRIRALPPPTADAPAQRAAFSGRLALLPESFERDEGRAGGAVYFAAAAHIAAHMTFTPGRLEPGGLKPVQLALVSLVEDARVEHLAMRRMPGLRRLWAPFHTARPDGARTMPSLLARLARALFDFDHPDPEPWVQKGRAMLQARLARLDDPLLARELGNLLGHDLGQMRIPTIARHHVVEPLYRDDNSGLWNIPPPEDAPEVEAIAIDTVRLEREERPDGGREDEPDLSPEAGKVRPAAAPPDEDGMPVAAYPEWDYRARIERPGWAIVRDARAPPAPAEAVRRAEEAYPALTRRIEALVRGARVGQPFRRKRQPDGEQLDLDAAVEATIAFRAGERPDQRVYQKVARRPRDLSLLLLLDGSRSTADRAAGPGGVTGGGPAIVSLERDAALVLARAMARLDDPLAIRSFDSNGREKVRIRRLKDFDEPFDRRAAARIAGLQPGLSTRLGAAIRHAGTELARRRSWRRLLVVVTDGEPSDIDQPDGRYLAEDARRAVHSLRGAGIDVFALGLDTGVTRAGREIFGRQHFLPIRDVADLPERLAMLYFRLLAR